MKRIPELRDLSDDHHRGLVLARRSRLAAEEGAAAVDAAWAEVEQGFRIALEPHFEIEERVLAPALREAGQGELVDRLLAEHAELRHLLHGDAERGARELGLFGLLLEQHIRFEERELFELAQEVLGPRSLEQVARACREREAPAEAGPTYAARIEEVEGRRVTRYLLQRGSEPLSRGEGFELWRTDGEFRAFFVELLAASTLRAFRFETPAVTRSTVDRPFEFVLLDCPELIRPPEPEAFAEHFSGATRGETVVTVANLGGDALMVVPTPVEPLAACAHLGAFTREAPRSANHDLWRAVGEALGERLSERPTWLNTAGMGISWLHVRLDSRPKYYGHDPYRRRP